MTLDRKTSILLAAVAGVGLLIAAQIAGATHPRPKSATPVRVSLVPAYEPCTAPNVTHGPPLGFPSCAPPVQSSNYLTVGTPDANGAPANSEGSVRLWVYGGVPETPDDAQVRISGNITDVRCKAGVSACGSANFYDGPDYTGELGGFATVRLTDHLNGPNYNQAATVVDIPVPFTLSCSSTSDPSIGSTCAFPVSGTECLGCFPPKDGTRQVAALTQIEVRDGGADGLVSTAGNTLFMVQGVFTP
jgi:hypothetical protein